MPRNRYTYVLTLREAAEILSQLESTPLPPWMLRRLLADCVSRDKCRQTRGRTQLYSTTDLLLARVALRLKGAGLSATLARSIITNHANAIIRGARSKHDYVLVVTGSRGEVMRAGLVEHSPGVTVLPLAAAWTGLIEAIRAVRREWPTVPLWNRQLPVEDAVLHLAPADCAPNC